MLHYSHNKGEQPSPGKQIARLSLNALAKGIET